MQRRLLLALALVVGIVGLTPQANADAVGNTARSVVRVVTIASSDGQVVGFGHGSGFAVAPNRVVTNAHVVELAQQNPDNVVIGVVPSQGQRGYQGHVIAIDQVHDLALIEFSGDPLPTATLTSQLLGGGAMVSALGYPGNVDLATARSVNDYILPVAPIRSEGSFGGTRSVNETVMLLHTAGIARGNSGGPLLDQCGRVVGVNSAITHNEDGDSTFAFAIAERELAAFLASANQPVTVSADPCVNPAASERGARDEAAQAERDARIQAELARSEQASAGAGAATQLREDVMGVATLVLVLGALLVGAGGILTGRAHRGGAVALMLLGVLVMVLAVVLFVLRPGGGIVGAPYTAAGSR